MMEWMMSNWEYVAIGILVIDKLVALSPSKMDDLIWSAVKKMIPRKK
jgi:hypothetical protein